MQRDGFWVEVISTGDEILFGRIVDTNSAWIARRAAELGAPLRRVTSVGDDLNEISGILREALERGPDLVLFTGGLGPSEDDLTVVAIGLALGRDVVFDQGAVERIRRRYEERGIRSTARGERMARVVDGSRALENPVGMATGMELVEGGSTIMTFPGVPSEMKAMFDMYAAPLIEGRSTSRFAANTVIAQVVFRDFFPVYRGMQADYPNVYIKNAATPPEAPEERLRVKDITVDVVTEGGSREESELILEDVLLELDRRLGEVGGRLILDAEFQRS
jgi:molybdenum cofactor synthesis domain-containing protein